MDKLLLWNCSHSEEGCEIRRSDTRLKWETHHYHQEHLNILHSFDIESFTDQIADFHHDNGLPRDQPPSFTTILDVLVANLTSVLINLVKVPFHIFQHTFTFLARITTIQHAQKRGINFGTGHCPLNPHQMQDPTKIGDSMALMAAFIEALGLADEIVVMNDVSAVHSGREDWLQTDRDYCDPPSELDTQCAYQQFVVIYEILKFYNVPIKSFVCYGQYAGEMLVELTCSTKSIRDPNFMNDKEMIIRLIDHWRSFSFVRERLATNLPQIAEVRAHVGAPTLLYDQIPLLLRQNIIKRATAPGGAGLERYMTEHTDELVRLCNIRLRKIIQLRKITGIRKTKLAEISTLSELTSEAISELREDFRNTSWQVPSKPLRGPLPIHNRLSYFEAPDLDINLQIRVIAMAIDSGNTLTR